MIPGYNDLIVCMPPDPKSGIYKMIWPNGCFYIGQSKNVFARKNQHSSDLKNGKHCNRFFSRLFNRYGLPAFEFIYPCKIAELDYWEQCMINMHLGDRRMVNASKSATSNRGFSHSEETKAKFSASRKGEMNGMFGKKHSEETREKLSKAHRSRPHKKGRIFSDEHRANMSKSRIGLKLSAEHRAAISLKSKKNGVSEVFMKAARLARIKKVACIETGQIFESLTSASKIIGIPITSLHRMVKQKKLYYYVTN